MSSTDQSNEQEQMNSARTEESSTSTPELKPGENRIEAGVSKYAIRKQVWTHFEKNGLVSFPRPLQGRVPNFHGAPDAALKLAELDVFKNANYVKVNTDKPQENVRILTLENEKKLLVPAPRTKEAVFMHVVPVSTEKQELKRTASRRGMLELGNLIVLGTDTKIDLVVVGSVAVSRDGRRIGKGEGLGDLEFAILVEIGAVTDDTVVVTTVHDSQVFDTLPENLFKEHDVPVDIIVTPNEVINIANKLPKPKGILWNILSQRKMNLMAVLPVLRNNQIAAGKECHLKEEDTDSETERTRRRLHQVRRFTKFTKKRVSTKSEGDKTGDEAKEGEDSKEKTKAPRRFNKRPLRKSINGGDPSSEPDIRKQKRVDQRRRRNPRNPPIEFSLRVGNITSNVRVRDLKNALAERNVKPTDITWRGHKGFAFLHFAKPRKEPEQPVLVDNIMASLQDMKINNSDEGVTLVVQPAKTLQAESPSQVTRIETTDITAV